MSFSKTRGLGSRHKPGRRAGSCARFVACGLLVAWTEASDIGRRASITREVMDTRLSSGWFRRLAALFPSV